MPTFLKQTYLKIKSISGDGACDTRLRYQTIQLKKAQPLIPPRTGQHTGSTVIPEKLRLQTSVFTVVMNTGKRPVVTSVAQSQKRRCQDISGCLAQKPA